MDKQQTTELATKLRACKPLATKLATYGLDITLSKVDITNIQWFEEMWRELDKPEQVLVLAQSGLVAEDIEMLVELIKHNKDWEIS
jgi:hypothetical protein